ncbi:uncharacterized protein LOC135105573 [Scylla paramamosain]|uniref:uncharacterized protein LOC135105573 n=1 Tax=Scylla paramamosain TaxID=85552 RepID=UPI003083A4D8
MFHQPSTFPSCPPFPDPHSLTLSLPSQPPSLARPPPLPLPFPLTHPVLSFVPHSPLPFLPLSPTRSPPFGRNQFFAFASIYKQFAWREGQNTPSTSITTAPQHLSTTQTQRNIMKTVLLLCLAALATSAPQSPQLQGFQEVERPTAILEEHHEVRGDGNFNYGYQSENGIVVEVSGEPGEQGQNRVKGMYRFPLPNGTIAEVTYTADEGGFKANSPLLPPVPQHAKEQIIIAKQQEAQGIVFE